MPCTIIFIWKRDEPTVKTGQYSLFYGIIEDLKRSVSSSDITETKF